MKGGDVQEKKRRGAKYGDCLAALAEAEGRFEVSRAAQQGVRRRSNLLIRMSCIPYFVPNIHLFSWTLKVSERRKKNEEIICDLYVYCRMPAGSIVAGGNQCSG